MGLGLQTLDLRKFNTMLKKKVYGGTLKEQLKANALDKSYNFLLAGDRIRGALVHATRMTNEMRANHELGILETLVLGHTYIAACLMAATLKGEDRIQIKISCSGPIKGLCAEANALGEVRGYLYQNPIPVKEPLKNLNLSPFFGAGFLTVTRYLQADRRPFSGQVALAYGNIAEDIAHYYASSEQTPTSLSLSIQFDEKGEVTGAGGLLLQALPGARDEDVMALENLVAGMEGIGKAFSEGKKAEEMILENFQNLEPRILDQKRVEFFCRCNEDQMAAYLKTLPQKDREDILENGPFPLEITCHNCNSSYVFSREKLLKILGNS